MEFVINQLSSLCLLLEKVFSVPTTSAPVGLGLHGNRVAYSAPAAGA